MLPCRICRCLVPMILGIAVVAPWSTVRGELLANNAALFAAQEEAAPVQPEPQDPPAGQERGEPAQAAPLWRIESIRDLTTPETAPLIAIGMVAVVALIVGLVLYRIGRRLLEIRRRPREAPQIDLTIDVPNLPIANVEQASPRMEIYGIPAVVAAVVVAPSGRDAAEPPKRVAFHLLEAVTPGFGEVLAGHQPLLCIWSAQLSSQGFAQLFFMHARLPGTRERGQIGRAPQVRCNGRGVPISWGLCFTPRSRLSWGSASWSTLANGSRCCECGAKGKIPGITSLCAAALEASVFSGLCAISPRKMVAKGPAGG